MEFRAWPKTPRLFKDIVITEKIDGTNACVIIRKDPGPMAWSIQSEKQVVVHTETDTEHFTVGAQSRNRLIHPEQDNAGFAAWVWENAEILAKTLGEGYHYGEWWGSGIQRGYGRTTKSFSLFNTHRWSGLVSNFGLMSVPVLYKGPFEEEVIETVLRDLQVNGSKASPEFPAPEGIIVYHTASKQVYKVTLDGDGGKWKDAA